MAPRQRELPFKVAKNTRSAVLKAKNANIESVTSTLKQSVTKSATSKSRPSIPKSAAPKRKQSNTKSTAPASKSVPLTLDEEVRQMLDVLSHDVPTSLPGRQKQIDQLNELLRECIEYQKSMSVYMYGSPGHGKTATVTLLCEDSYIRANFETVFMNCMSLNNLTAVYKEIITRFNKKSSSNSKQVSIDEVVKSIDSGRKPLLLILDEFDTLIPRGDSLFFYSLFELKLKLKKQQIAFIGIGNRKNFIDKLPLLKYNRTIMPVLMEFRAYDKSEMIDIFTTRLNSVEQNQLVFSETAVELLAAKAASFGNLRQALFVATEAVHHALENPSEDGICKIDPFTINEVYKSTKTNDSIDHFVFYPKLIICCALRILNEKPNKTTLFVKELYDAFVKVCSDKNFAIISLDQFKHFCRFIEDEGVFSIIRKKSDKSAVYLDHKIIMNWSVSEMTEELRNMPVFGPILAAEEN